MRAATIVLLAMQAGPALCQDFDRPVTSFETRGEGEYTAGFLHWATIASPFLAEVEVAIFGRVASVGHPYNSADIGSSGLRIDVLEVLRCPPELAHAVSTVRSVSTFDPGLAIGDSLVVFMVRYEGEFAVLNWRGTNTPLGHKLSGSAQPFCAPADLLRLIRQPHAWDVSALTPTELRLWRCIDPEGVLEALIREKEEEQPTTGTEAEG